MEQYFLLFASKVKEPMLLAALFAVILFFIFKQVLAKNIFPSLTKASSFLIIKSVIDRLFWLSLIATILGTLSYLYIYSNTPSLDPKSEFTEDQKKVIELEEKISLLQAPYEASMSDDEENADYFRGIVEQKAASLAAQIETYQDQNLDPKALILKYDAASMAYVMASAVEANKRKKIIYADNAIKNGNTALNLIRAAADDAEMLEWTNRKRKEEFTLHVLILAHSIKIREGYTDLINKTHNLINELPKYYKDSGSLNDKDIKWFLQAYPSQTIK